jgi:hypothetical protein
MGCEIKVSWGAPGGVPTTWRVFYVRFDWISVNKDSCKFLIILSGKDMTTVARSVQSTHKLTFEYLKKEIKMIK